MQVLDEEKRQKILAAAAELFATQPFHKVLLSDVAEAAGVGKGTLYVYFKSKEDLYFSLFSQGFSKLLASVRQRIAAEPNDAMTRLECVIGEYVSFAVQNPQLFELLGSDASERPERVQNRRELVTLIESLIREGITQGQFDDSHPELTARYIAALLRSVFVCREHHVDPDTVREHLSQFVRKALCCHAKTRV
jgi:AcrR family transcriptional regulator